MNLALRLLLIFAFSGPRVLAQTPPTSRRPVTPPATTAESEKEDDEDSSDEEDEEGEGDPYRRYARSKSRNQNCDPTILESFYVKYGRFSCLLSNSGVCITPGKDEASWAFYAGLAGLGADVRAGFTARTTARLRADYLRSLDTQIREMAVAIERSTAETLARGARPMLLAEAERAAARTAGGIILRNGTRGAVLGFLGGGAVGVAIMAVDISLTHGISATACAGTLENDPNFRKYVPLEKGTCRTPQYNAGAPQVREFLKLPLKDKLKILNENPMICGFYRSMNEELDKRIAELEGSRAIGSVTCNNTTGDITFKTINNASRTLIIKRKPGTKEPTQYQYRDYIAPNIATQSADFDLVKTENGLDMTRMRILSTGLAIAPRTILYENFSRFSRENPPVAQALLYAFRTTRTHADTLIACCDMSATDLAKKENQEKCPAHWFPARTNTPPPTSRPPSTTR